jgi:hypothetical protein
MRPCGERRCSSEVLISREVDVLVDEADVALPRIVSELGPESALEAAHSIYVDAVTGRLPEGWDARTRELRVGSVIARCLETHDLVLSKLAAGRLKDYELVAVLFDRTIADVAAVRERIGTVADLHMRSILLARLQIVLESAGR